MALPEHPDPVVRLLLAQVHSLRQQVQVQGEMINTMWTPPWKRLWFFLQGWRLWRLGRWYRASWNAHWRD